MDSDLYAGQIMNRLNLNFAMLVMKTRDKEVPLTATITARNRTGANFLREKKEMHIIKVTT